MFKFNRGGTEYTVGRGSSTDSNLLLCTYEESEKAKWLVVRDTDDLNSPVLYPNQSTIKENAYDFMAKFIDAVNSELDKKHGEATEDPQTASEWVDHIVGYKMSFDGKHVKINQN